MKHMSSLAHAVRERRFSHFPRFRRGKQQTLLLPDVENRKNGFPQYRLCFSQPGGEDNRR